MQIAGELQIETGTLWNTIGKSREQKRGTLLYREQEEEGRSFSESKSIGGKQEFSVVMVSHWLSCSNFSLAVLLLGKEKIFLSSAEVVT